MSVSSEVSTQAKGELLAIVEFGGYPDFTPVYQQLGYQVETSNSMRNAIRTLKKLQPSVIVAEFNFQSDFRDRTSNLESLLAVVQRMPGTRVIVFYEEEFASQFVRVSSRFPIHKAITFPVDIEELKAAL
jgi:DNA-binding NtrC family response regulator